MSATTVPTIAFFACVIGGSHENMYIKENKEFIMIPFAKKKVSYINEFMYIYRSHKTQCGEYSCGGPTPPGHFHTVPNSS